MAKKEPVKTSVWVFWILIAIIGVGMLFTGLQSSVLGDNITTSVMLIVIGIILLFVGLIMTIGKANNQMEWVQKMNNIKSRAEEFILNEVIYE